MKETYKVKRPDRIVWGDPWYMEKYTGEELKSLIVDFQPPKHFEARVVLEEKPLREYSGTMLDTMTIYLAPSQTIETYMQGMMYVSQQQTEKDIGVDTAQYLIRIDENDDVIHTGGDGYWGSYSEMFRMNGERKILDAAIITIAMSDYETMESMREYLNYFFENVEQMETENVLEETTEKQADAPQQTM